MTPTTNFLSAKPFLGNPGIVSNLTQGGQLGAGYKSGAFDAATPLVMPPAVICVLQTPTMWDNMPDDPDGLLRETVKAMFECHAKAVTGIDIVYAVETQEQPVGHDGQNFQVPTRTTRQAVTPNFTWPEITGNLVWNLIKRWMWDISDPDTQAGLTHMEDEDNNKYQVSPYTMSAYSITFMAIQYDKTMHPDRILDAAIYTNVWPTNSGELGIERTIGTVKVPERSVPFSGYVMHNELTRDLGVDIAHVLSLRTETWKRAAPYQGHINELLNVHPGNRGIIDDKDLKAIGGEQWERRSTPGLSFEKGRPSNASTPNVTSHPIAQNASFQPG